MPPRSEGNDELSVSYDSGTNDNVGVEPWSRRFDPFHFPFERIGIRVGHAHGAPTGFCKTHSLPWSRTNGGQKQEERTRAETDSMKWPAPLSGAVREERGRYPMRIDAPHESHRG